MCIHRAVTKSEYLVIDAIGGLFAIRSDAPFVVWDDGFMQIDEYGFPGPMRDRLVEAILSGEKTATSSLLMEYEPEGGGLPEVGSRAVVLDSGDVAVAVTELTGISVVPLGSVSLTHVVAEGEGFQTVTWWRNAHERFWNSEDFRAELGQPRFSLDDDTLVVCETFRVAWRIERPLAKKSLQQLWQLFPIELSEYRDKYPAVFESQAKVLQDLFDGRLVRISHIGSTAVPGLTAKPIIDILAEVSDDIPLRHAIAFLEAAGWSVMRIGNSEEMDVSFCLGYTADGFAGDVFHLHMRKLGDPDELYFRDFLLESKAAQNEYVDIKRRLAVECRNDRDAYTAGKTDFIRQATAKMRLRIGGLYEGLVLPIEVAAVVIKDRGKILTVGKNGSKYFQLPGGKLEQGESAMDAAIRECHEETGIIVRANELKPLGTFSAAAANEPGRQVRSQVFIYMGSNIEASPKAEIARIRWTPLDEAKDPGDLAPLLRTRIFPALRGEI